MLSGRSMSKFSFKRSFCSTKSLDPNGYSLATVTLVFSMELLPLEGKETRLICCKIMRVIGLENMSSWRIW